jgi:hypothetical protein
MVDDLGKSGNKGSSNPNFNAKLLEKSKERASSWMHHVMMMLYVKTYTRTTNKTFNMFLEVLCSALPWVDFSKDYADAKRVLSEVGLGYETIHVCKFDCALFWRANKDKTHCPECGLSRWQDPTTTKKVHHKVIR